MLHLGSAVHYMELRGVSRPSFPNSWGLWCFAGFFAKNGCLIVVFWWCKRGGLLVKRGVLAVSFLASKRCAMVSEFIFWGSRFGNAIGRPAIEVLQPTLRKSAKDGAPDRYR